MLEEATVALEGLDRAAGALHELRGAAGEVGQIVAGVTGRPSEVPLYGGKSRHRVDLIALVHALRQGGRFIGDPLVPHPQVHDQILSGVVPQHLKVSQP